MLAKQNPACFNKVMKQCEPGLDAISPSDPRYNGLKATWPAEFPKSCPTCNRQYPSFEDYIKATTPLANNTGLMCCEIRDNERQVGVFRNCACGTTLMTFCRDRRDPSQSGNHRRRIFAATVAAN